MISGLHVRKCSERLEASLRLGDQRTFCIPELVSGVVIPEPTDRVPPAVYRI
jgi:hypothetical protein